MTKKFDVIIVGASVAGASLAIRLGIAGVSCALLDRSHFPRRKSCGEGLSSVGVEAIRELGVGAEFDKLPHSEFYGYSIFRSRDLPASDSTATDLPASGLYRTDRTDLGSGESRGRGIERLVLDDFLVRKASECSSVSAYLGVNVRGIERSSGSYQVRTKEGSVTSRYLVIADGSASFVSQRLGVARQVINADRYGYSLVFDGAFAPVPSYIPVFLAKHCEVYLTPVSRTRLNVSITGPRHLFDPTDRSSLRRLLDPMFERIGFTGAEAMPILGRGPLGTISREPFKDDALLIGDACETLDPIAGMGMTHALLTSKLAANALIEHLSGQKCWETARREYAALRKEAVAPIRGFTRIIYFLLHTCRSPGILGRLHHSSFGKRMDDVIFHPEASASIPRALMQLAGFVR